MFFLQCVPSWGEKAIFCELKTFSFIIAEQSGQRVTRNNANNVISHIHFLQF